ncbi:DUF4393 domain-containing protein [Paenibacillus sp. HGF5]|uniref:DUF4393 domain-containing protein n=1 Tax=Paenibacillus sp. HGF5 TaxID=908341 RepID=UPI0002072D6F|nr:DUF4393 domain-containing protein [Paenibacillus sp. HGF5]EGG35241.1 hypothetical protein HMPREF9412_3221 [Paenibacillus sp. HGF5]
MANFLEDLVKSIKVPTDIAKNVLEPSSKEVGEGLGSLFYLAFSPLQKAKIKKEYEIKLFKEDIEKELNKIPSEDIVEPRLNIVAPALEAAKYYIEDVEIRSMFAKLIAASMNKNKKSGAHPSYVEIIKQMSPLDAATLSFLFSNRNNIGCGSLVLNAFDGQGGHIPIIHNFFPFQDINKQNYLDYSASVDNLVRLGLIFIDNNRAFNNNFFYHALENHPLVLEMRRMFSEQPSGNATSLSIRRTAWEITQFGQNFCICCF